PGLRSQLLQVFKAGRAGIAPCGTIGHFQRLNLETRFDKRFGVPVASGQRPATDLAERQSQKQIGGRVDLGRRYTGRRPRRGEVGANVSSRRNLTELHPELLAYAQSLTLDKAAAEDLVHDALVRALQ